MDFKQTYDYIDGDAVFEIMNEFDISALSKFNKFNQGNTHWYKLQVHEPDYTIDPSNIETGLRQGDKLSTIPFNLGLQKVVRDMSINWKGTIFYSSKEIAAFAVDTDMGRGTLARIIG